MAITKFFSITKLALDGVRLELWLAYSPLILACKRRAHGDGDVRSLRQGSRQMRDGIVGRPMSQPRAATNPVAPGGTGGGLESALCSLCSRSLLSYTTIALSCAQQGTKSYVASHGVSAEPLSEIEVGVSARQSCDTITISLGTMFWIQDVSFIWRWKHKTRLLHVNNQLSQQTNTSPFIPTPKISSL